MSFNFRLPSAIAGLYIVLSSNTWAQPDQYQTSAPEVLLTQAAMLQMSHKYAQFAINPEVNSALSPLSLFEAMLIAGYGARGMTRHEILEFLYGADVNAANQEPLMASYQRAENSDGFTIANAAMVDKSLPYRKEYFDTIKRELDASLIHEDFKDPAALSLVNTWFAKNSGGKITKMLDGPLIDVKLILANALHFKSKWAEPFSKSATKKGDFYVQNGGVFSVDFMNTTRRMPYLNDEEWQVARLDTENEDIAIIFALPPEQQTMEDSLTEVLTSQRLQEWFYEDYSNRKVWLSLPKFSLELGGSVKKILEKRLGMKIMFSDAADFRGITASPSKMSAFRMPPSGADSMGITSDPSKKIKVDDVVHKITFEIDEEGAEASAATAVIFSPTSMRRPLEPDPIRMNLDRPFFAWIVNTKTRVPIMYACIARPG